MVEVLGSRKKGLPFIISGPAGTGKTTLVNMLTKDFPCIKESISFTTRPKRPEEVSGDHYHFISDEEFEAKIENGDFLEYVQLFDQRYGTSKSWVEKQLNAGIHVILTIDTQGALYIKEKNLLPAVYIFLSPPSLEELTNRIRERKTETPEMIAKRLERAKQEMALSEQYDYKIINDDLTVTYEVLKSIFITEEHKT